MDNQRNIIEHQGSSPAEKGKIEKKQDESRELREASKEFVEGVSEVVESAESGEIAEKTSEDKKAGPQGKFPTQAGRPVKLQPPSLVLPRIEVMQIQIAVAVKKEIAVLMEAARVTKHPYELTGVLAKIRNLKDILSDLIHAPLETIKSLWMKFVKKSS